MMDDEGNECQQFIFAQNFYLLNNGLSGLSSA